MTAAALMELFDTPRVPSFARDIAGADGEDSGDEVNDKMEHARAAAGPSTSTLGTPLPEPTPQPASGASPRNGRRTKKKKSVLDEIDPQRVLSGLYRFRNGNTGTDESSGASTEASSSATTPVVPGRLSALSALDSPRVFSSGSGKARAMPEDDEDQDADRSGDDEDHNHAVAGPSKPTTGSSPLSIRLPSMRSLRIFDPPRMFSVHSPPNDDLLDPLTTTTDSDHELHDTDDVGATTEEGTASSPVAVALDHVRLPKMTDLDNVRFPKMSDLDNVRLPNMNVVRSGLTAGYSSISAGYAAGYSSLSAGASAGYSRMSAGASSLSAAYNAGYNAGTQRVSAGYTAGYSHLSAGYSSLSASYSGFSGWLHSDEMGGGTESEINPYVVRDPSPTAKRESFSSGAHYHSPPTMNLTIETSPIDHNMYPHVMEAIIQSAPRKVLIALRATCNRYHDLVDDMFAAEVRITARHGVQSEFYGTIPALGHQLPAGDHRSGSRFPGAAALKEESYRRVLRRAKRVAVYDQPDIPARDLQALSSLLPHVQVATMAGAYGLRRGTGCYPCARHHIYFLVPDTLAHSDAIPEPSPPVLPKELRWLELVFFCTMSPLGRLEIPIPAFPPALAVVRVRFKLKHLARKRHHKPDASLTRQASTPAWGFLSPLVQRMAEAAAKGTVFFVDGVNCLSPASLSLPNSWAGHLDERLRDEVDRRMETRGMDAEEREVALENIVLRNPRESEYRRAIEGER